MKLISINETYLDYLRENGDPRIPHVDYGIGKIKPFFVLFDLNEDVSYISQLSSYKNRHHRMHDQLDFHKIWTDENRCRAVVNLNYMFPILKTNYFELNREDIKRIKENGTMSEAEISDYMEMLDEESYFIDHSNLGDCAKRLYELKKDRPGHAISLRSLDFKEMEAKMIEFELAQQHAKDDFSVEFSQEESSFIISDSNGNRFIYQKSVLEDVNGLFQQVDQAIQANQKEVNFEK